MKGEGGREKSECETEKLKGRGVRWGGGGVGGRHVESENGEIASGYVDCTKECQGRSLRKDEDEKNVHS